MPQEIQVLQCFKCNFFQGQVVKKKPQWECKMCFEKQSVKKVYMRSKSGRECREYVQQLNLMHQCNKHEDINICISNDSKNEMSYLKEHSVNNVQQDSREKDNSISVVGQSRWNEFLDDKEVKCKSHCHKSETECSLNYLKRSSLNNLEEVYEENNESQLRVNQIPCNDFLNRDLNCRMTNSHKREHHCDRSELEGSTKYLKCDNQFKNTLQLVASRKQPFCSKNIFENEDTDLDLDI